MCLEIVCFKLSLGMFVALGQNQPLKKDLKVDSWMEGNKTEERDWGDIDQSTQTFS